MKLDSGGEFALEGMLSEVGLIAVVKTAEGGAAGLEVKAFRARLGEDLDDAVVRVLFAEGEDAGLVLGPEAVEFVGLHRS